MLNCYWRVFLSAVGVFVTDEYSCSDTHLICRMEFYPNGHFISSLNLVKGLSKAGSAS